MKPNEHEPVETAPVDQGSSKPTLAKQITGWTNNLLATSMVLVVALAVGSQLIGMWSDRPDSSSDLDSGNLTAWPQLESCAIEFGNRPYQLHRKQLNATRDEVTRLLQRDCREILESNPVPSGPMGPAERRMLASSISVSPVEEVVGRWRLIQVRDPAGNQLPMFIGIKDNNQESGESRMVVWGIAMGSGEDQWTTFVCQGVAADDSNQQNGREFPIPPGSHRTLTIGDHNEGYLIGFSGGDPGTAKRFFNRCLDRQNWLIKQDWRQLANGWQAVFVSEVENQKSEINIQLLVDRDETLRGLVAIQPDSLSR